MNLSQVPKCEYFCLFSGRRALGRKQKTERFYSLICEMRKNRFPPKRFGLECQELFTLSPRRRQNIFRNHLLYINSPQTPKDFEYKIVRNYLLYISSPQAPECVECKSFVMRLEIIIFQKNIISNTYCFIV